MIVCENGIYREATSEEIENLKKLAEPPSIEELQSQLSESDYKIIKCYEYALAGLDLPYDVVKLHEERQLLRDKINRLQGGVTDV